MVGDLPVVLSWRKSKKAFAVKMRMVFTYCCFFSSRRRHTRFDCDWSSDVCSSDLKRQHHRSRLCGNHATVAVVVIARISAQRREKQQRHLARESKNSQQRRRARQPV